MSHDNHSIPVSVDRGPIVGEGHEPPVAPEAHGVAVAATTPLIDIHEGPDGLVLIADLPGASDETLKIQLEDNVLSLHAHVVAPAPEDARTLYEEYRVGDYQRSFILSDEVERTRITAELKNGVLRLTLPKAERAKTRRIEIKS